MNNLNPIYLVEFNYSTAVVPYKGGGSSKASEAINPDRVWSSKEWASEQARKTASGSANASFARRAGRAYGRMKSAWNDPANRAARQAWMGRQGQRLRTFGGAVKHVWNDPNVRQSAQNFGREIGRNAGRVGSAIGRRAGRFGSWAAGAAPGLAKTSLKVGAGALGGAAAAGTLATVGALGLARGVIGTAGKAVNTGVNAVRGVTGAISDVGNAVGSVLHGPAR